MPRYMGGSGAIPTPAAMPQVMQQAQSSGFQPTYGQGYPSPSSPMGGRCPQDYGMGQSFQQPAQQPMMPQPMEYGQRAGDAAAPQQMQQQTPMGQPPVAQPTPAEQSPPPSAARDDLGVPAFLRRPTKK